MHVGESAEKKDVLERLLELGMVLVALDARADGVDVPDHLGRDPQLRLNLSYRFGLPMAVDPWGIDATLTFGGVPYACRFPWGAIYLLVSHVNGEPYLFPDEVPPELLAQVGVEGAWSLPNEKRRAAPGNRPKLSLVVAADEPEERPSADASAERTPTSGAPAKGEPDPSAPTETGTTVAAARPGARRGSRATARRAPELRPAAPQPPDQPGAEPEAEKSGRGPVDAPAAEASSEHATPPRPGADAPAADAASSARDDAPTGSGPSRRRGHLRLVK